MKRLSTFMLAMMLFLTSTPLCKSQVEFYTNGTLLYGDCHAIRGPSSYWLRGNWIGTYSTPMHMCCEYETYFTDVIDANPDGFVTIKFFASPDRVSMDCEKDGIELSHYFNLEYALAGQVRLFLRDPATGERYEEYTFTPRFEEL